jgi:hypothetical protein
VQFSGKQAVLAANTNFSAASGTSKPSNAGPIIPEMLSCRPLNLAAEGSRASETTRTRTRAVFEGGNSQVCTN